VNRAAALPKLGLFDPKDPVALGRALALYENNVAAYLRDRATAAFGPFEQTAKQTATYNARPWQIVRVDPTAGAVTILLPSLTASGAKDAWVVVKNASASTNLINVLALNAKIDGGASIVLSTAWQSVWFYAATDQWETAGLV
jgi:hypothetical protein